jgi:hypothetical protein
MASVNTASTSVVVAPQAAIALQQAQAAQQNAQTMAAMQQCIASASSGALRQSPGPDLAAQGQEAAGKIGAYMHDNKMAKCDVNDLYKMANNEGGKVPPDVQDAAKFMLSNPEIYKKIETADVKGADGISGINNFDKAAQGLIDLKSPSQPPSHPMPMASIMPVPTRPDLGIGLPGGAEPSQAKQGQEAAGTLAAYMRDNGMNKVDANDLYKIANNEGGKVPPDVQDAAKFLLANPDVYKKIETADVKGADGISGTGNLNKAAQGLVNLESPEATQKLTTGLDNALQAMQQPATAGAMAASPALAALLERLKNLQQTQGGELQPAADAVAGHPVMEAGVKAKQFNDQCENAAGKLGAYMNDNKMAKCDVNDLYKIANNEGGKVPPDVQDAAKFMLANPDVYKKIETTDVAGADGISSANNFDKAAQGLVKFTPPTQQPGGVPAEVAQPTLDGAKDIMAKCPPGSPAEDKLIDTMTNDLLQLMQEDLKQGKVDPAKVKMLEVLTNMKEDPLSVGGPPQQTQAQPAQTAQKAEPAQTAQTAEPAQTAQKAEPAQEKAPTKPLHPLNPMLAGDQQLRGGMDQILQQTLNNPGDQLLSNALMQLLMVGQQTPSAGGAFMQQPMPNMFALQQQEEPEEVD